MRSDYLHQLQKIFEIQDGIQDISPYLEKLFPIAVVENGHFLIYDIEPSGSRYQFVKKAATPMPVPDGVRAAFSLESYDNQMACVVTGDVFDELPGYVIIFHEFIHCQQFEICEQELKQRLGIALQAQAANDYMWEINHPFSYAAPEFVELYKTFLTSGTLQEAEEVHQQLKSVLSVADYEYMVWQEWKEGFARLIENRVSQRLDLSENHFGREQPFNRVTFYEGGAHYIQNLEKQEPDLLTDIEALFSRMFE